MRRRAVEAGGGCRNGKATDIGQRHDQTVSISTGQIEVKAGTKVTWVNEDEIFHIVTAEKSGSDLNGALDGKGKKFSYIFDRPGSFAYYCDRHEHMRGEIIVR
jgi:plastocyanin